jgi:hypothetical protein
MPARAVEVVAGHGQADAHAHRCGFSWIATVLTCAMSGSNLAVWHIVYRD